MVERRASDRNVTEPWFNFRIGNASSCPWKDILRLISSRSSNLPVVVTQPDERHANRIYKSASALVWLHRRRLLASYEQMSGI